MKRRRSPLPISPLPISLTPGPSGARICGLRRRGARPSGRYSAASISPPAGCSSIPAPPSAAGTSSPCWAGSMPPMDPARPTGQARGLKAHGRRGQSSSFSTMARSIPAKPPGRPLRQAQEAARPWLKIEWLPKYAPELNDIERSWRDLKCRFLAHQTFSDPDHLDRAIDKAIADMNHACQTRVCTNLRNVA